MNKQVYFIRFIDHHYIQFIDIQRNKMDTFQLDKEFQINNNHDDTYYHEYCRLYLANIALTTQVKQLIEEKNHLFNRLSKYQDQEFSQSDKYNQKCKRMRRNADQIERYYKCSVKACAKSYGSEGSLNQHYKLKHPQIYVTLPNVQSNIGSNSCSMSHKSKQQSQQCSRDKQNRFKMVNMKHK